MRKTETSSISLQQLRMCFASAASASIGVARCRKTPGIERSRWNRSIRSSAGSRPVSSRRRKRPSARGIEPPRGEHAGSAIENLRGPLGDRLGRESIAGDRTQVVDPRLFAGPTAQAVVEEQLQPEQEIGVEVVQGAGRLERLVLQTPGLLRVQLDRRGDDAAAVGADRLSDPPSDLPEIAADERRRQGQRRQAPGRSN